MTARRSNQEVQAILQAGGLSTDAEYVNKDTPMACTCNECNRDVQVRLGVVIRGQKLRPGGTACRYCLGQEIPPEDAILDMRILGRAEPLEGEVYPGAHKKWRCKCLDCGEVVTPKLAKVRFGQRACKACAIKEFAESRQLSDAYARNFMVNAGAIPDAETPYPGALKPWKSVCATCGDVIYPRYGNIQSGNGPCTACGYGVLADKQRIPDDEAKRLMVELGGADPEVPYPGAHTPWLCTCKKCGNSITPRLASVKAGQGACIYCAEKGIDYAAPSIVYTLALHIADGEASLNVVKVGIANEESARLKLHQSRGWRVVEVAHFKTGREALTVEQSLIRVWRKSGASFVPKEFVPEGDGYTETVELSDAAWLNQFSLIEFARELGVSTI